MLGRSLEAIDLETRPEAKEIYKDFEHVKMAASQQNFEGSFISMAETTRPACSVWTS